MLIIRTGKTKEENYEKQNLYEVYLYHILNLINIQI